MNPTKVDSPKKISSGYFSMIFLVLTMAAKEK
jgi:hypothetical protein